MGSRPVSTPRERWGPALLLGLAVAGYPLASYLPELLGVGSRAVSVPYRAAFLALAAAVFVDGFNRRRFAQPWWLWLLAGTFWLLYLFRLTLDASVWAASLRLPWHEYVLWAVGGSLVPFLAAAAAPPRGALRLALPVTLTLLGLAAGSAALGFLLRGGFVVTGIRRFSGSSALGSIWFGHLGASLAIVSTFVLLRGRLPSRTRTVAVVGLLVLGLAVVGLSASRGPALALATAALLLVASRWRRGSRLRIAVLVATVVAAGIWVLDRLGGRLLIRIGQLAAGELPARRAELYGRTLEQFLRHPFIGSGLEEQVTGYYPHNVLLEGFMATGVVGGLALALLLAVASILAVRLLWRAPEHGWVSLLFIQYALAAMLSSALFMSTTMWTYLGAVLALGWSLRAPATPSSVLTAASGAPDLPARR